MQVVAVGHKLQWHKADCRSDGYAAQLISERCVEGGSCTSELDSQIRISSSCCAYEAGMCKCAPIRHNLEEVLRLPVR